MARAADSKMSFCDGFMQLKEEDLADDAAGFWNSVWETPVTIYEVFQFITPADVRAIREQRPGNMQKLLKESVAVMQRVVTGDENFAIAQTACRVVTRVIPILLEHDTDGFLESTLWQGEEPLGARLAHSLVQLLFVPDGTIYPSSDPPAKTDNGIEKNLLWMSSRGTSKQMDTARQDVLRCLLACSSNAIYSTLDVVTSTTDRFLRAVTSESNPLVPTLTFSLVNVVFSYDPVGWGVPYNQQMFGDSREPVVDTALHLLLVMLNARYRVTTAEEEEIQNQDKNAVVALIADMNRPETLGRLYDGFVRLLVNPMQANNTWMPYSMKQIRCHQELLIFLWDIIDLNPLFVDYLIAERNACELVVPVVYLMVDARKDPAKMGLLNVCTFILLRLSGHREFGVQLNNALNVKLPGDLPQITGNHADLIVIAVHKLVVDGVERGDTLIDTLLTVLCNVSPYIRSISMLASMRLLGLFEVFGTSKLLLHRERAHSFVYMLLEIFNNVIQYQYTGNPHLVYALVRRKSVFKQLAGLELAPVAVPVSVDTDGDTVNPLAAEPQKAAEAQAAAPEAAAPEAAVVPEFVPTEQWLQEWKAKMPLEPVLRLLDALCPKIEKLCAEDPNASETSLLEAIQSTTMVGLLPVPHQILVRKYVQNKNMNKWFTAYIWGTIYMHNQNPPIFDSEKITLFTIFFKRVNNNGN